MNKPYTPENLELANATLRRYAQQLEEKVARYEQLLRRCPKFRMEEGEAAKSVCTGNWLVVPDEPFHRDPEHPNIYRGNYRPSAAPSIILEKPYDPTEFADDEDFLDEGDWFDEEEFLDEDDFLNEDDWGY